MEYENNTKQVVHVNGPHEQVIRNDGFNEAYEMDRLLQDVDAVNRSLLTLYPDMEIDPNMVFEQLEVVKDNTNRVYHVVSLLSQLHRTFLNNKEQKGAFQAATDDEPVIVQEEVPQKKDVEVFTIHDDEETAETNNEDDNPVVTITLNDDAPEVKDVYGMLVKDVDLIMDVFPDTDPQEVYAYLEARRDDPQRVANVIEELIHRRPVENVETATDVLPTRQNVPQNLSDERKRAGEAVDANVPVPHKKLRSIKSMEIEESVQDIKEEPVSSNEEDEDIEAPNIAPTVEASTSAATLAAEPSGSSLEEDISASQKLVSQLQVLKDTFPDADRDYLSELLSSCVDDEAKLQATVSDMLEKREYPKLKDQLERERLQALKKEYSSRIFTPEEVLQWFEDPIAFFSDNSTTVSKNYERHAYAQLHNEFPKLTLVDIKRTLSNHNQHYTGAFHKLKEQLQLECKTTKFKRRKARATMSLPEEPDELFYKELAFTRTEEKLKDYLKTKEVRKTQRMEEAKAGGELLTCACCYDDENLPEEMIDCGSGHLFCRECVRRGAEVAIGDGKNGLDCMSDKCGSKFDLPSLQQVLKSSTFSNLLKRIQAEEISNAEIPDLVQCPHCSFAAIMPNQEDKVFRCLNSDCLKETCRFCKEPNHIPLRCEEVEKSDEVKMRTYIENKMTDALVRKCYRCSRRFMKEEGCNKMTCVCGATMCYVCRQPIKDYTHFQKGGCPQMSDTLKLHRDEILQGAESAKKEFVEQHPEMKDAQLKHDPTKDLPKNGEHPEPLAAARAGIAHNLVQIGHGQLPFTGLLNPFLRLNYHRLTGRQFLEEALAMTAVNRRIEAPLNIGAGRVPLPQMAPMQPLPSRLATAAVDRPVTQMQNRYTATATRFAKAAERLEVDQRLVTEPQVPERPASTAKVAGNAERLAAMDRPVPWDLIPEILTTVERSTPVARAADIAKRLASIERLYPRPRDGNPKPLYRTGWPNVEGYIGAEANIFDHIKKKSSEIEPPIPMDVSNGSIPINADPTVRCMTINKHPEIQAKARPVLQAAKLFACQSFDGSDTPGDNRAPTCAASSTANGSASSTNPPILDNLPDSNNVNKSVGLVSSSTDSRAKARSHNSGFHKAFVDLLNKSSRNRGFQAVTNVPVTSSGMQNVDSNTTHNVPNHLSSTSHSNGNEASTANVWPVFKMSIDTSTFSTHLDFMDGPSPLSVTEDRPFLPVTTTLNNPQIPTTTSGLQSSSRAQESLGPCVENKCTPKDYEFTQILPPNRQNITFNTALNLTTPFFEIPTHNGSVFTNDDYTAVPSTSTGQRTTRNAYQSWRAPALTSSASSAQPVAENDDCLDSSPKQK